MNGFMLNTNSVYNVYVKSSLHLQIGQQQDMIAYQSLQPLCVFMHNNSFSIVVQLYFIIKQSHNIDLYEVKLYKY